MLTECIPQLALPVNELLLSQLEAMITACRLPHAIVIEGENPRLNGQLARLLARAHLCECERPLEGRCLVCRKLNSTGFHPDVIIVEGSGKTGSISIASIRQLQGLAALVPSEARGVVCLLEGADSMDGAAQNASLQIFEEPPDGVMLIMTCISSLKLLETIRSRALVLKASWQTDDEVESTVQDELAALAQSFALSLRDAQDIKSLLIASRFSKNRKDPSNARRELEVFLEQLRIVLRQALVIGEGAREIIDKPSAAADELAGSMTADSLMQMISELEGLEAARRTNASMALLTTAMCVRLRRAAGR